MTGKPVDRSILSGESIILFRAAIRNAATRDPYERRLILFLNTIGMDPDSFVDLAGKKPLVAEKKVISYIIEQRTGAESRGRSNNRKYNSKPPKGNKATSRDE